MSPREESTLTFEDLREINALVVSDYGGGASGVKYQPGVESSAHRPFVTLFGEEQFPSPEMKAAALMKSLIRNHPFHDGNKRSAFLSGITLYEVLTEKPLTVSPDEAVRACLETEARRWDTRELARWFAARGAETSPP